MLNIFTSIILSKVRLDVHFCSVSYFQFLWKKFSYFTMLNIRLYAITPVFSYFLWTLSPSTQSQGVRLWDLSSRNSNHFWKITQESGENSWEVQDFQSVMQMKKKQEMWKTMQYLYGKLKCPHYIDKFKIKSFFHLAYWEAVFYFLADSQVIQDKAGCCYLCNAIFLGGDDRAESDSNASNGSIS